MFSLEFFLFNVNMCVFFKRKKVCIFQYFLWSKDNYRISEICRHKHLFSQTRHMNRRQFVCFSFLITQSSQNSNNNNKAITYLKYLGVDFVRLQWLEAVLLKCHYNNTPNMYRCVKFDKIMYFFWKSRKERLFS